jgi:hypothetical protein
MASVGPAAPERTGKDVRPRGRGAPVRRRVVRPVIDKGKAYSYYRVKAFPRLDGNFFWPRERAAGTSSGDFIMIIRCFFSF